MGGLYNSTAWGQQTLAAQTLAAKASGRRGGMRSARKRRKARASVSAPRKRRSKARTRSKARLVKGSAAAKRYMASIRRKRRK
jgi:hypothetical protein